MEQFSNKTITVKITDADQRLDVFLASKLEISRAQTQKLIKAGQILINGKIANAHYKIQEKDNVNIKALKHKSIKTLTELELPRFETIAETDDYLVINKPAGLIVHGGNSITEPTLTDALEKKYPDLRKIGDDPTRPGIVHRLDKEASGLLVVAKTNAMFDALKQQFKNRLIKKTYAALVYGNIIKDADEINFSIARSAQGYRMSALPRSGAEFIKKIQAGGLPRRSPESRALGAGTKAGRAAITEFTVTEHFINYTLLSVTIKTGRTHQIRVHLAAYNHPLVGDTLYGTRRTKELNKKLGLNRIWLHAQTLGFSDLRGEWQEFNSEVPKELKEIMKKVK
ncbi:MAG: RluA family pseudouridine synthase [Patescibacteria group bacterium]